MVSMTGLKCTIIEHSGEQWDEFINSSPWGDLLQFREWGEIKREEGWTPLRLAVVRKKAGKDEIILAAQILFKRASMLGNYGYIPHGPVFHSMEDLEEGLPVLVEFIQNIASTYNLFTVEIEPKLATYLGDDGARSNLNHYANPKLLEIFLKNGFQTTRRNMQPKYKLYYDLSLDEEELLKLCHKSTRYNIKLAQKKGVQLQEYTASSPNIQAKLEEFYRLLQETQARAKGYPIRPFKSFLKMFQVFPNDSKAIRLFEASYNGEVIAMNISQRTKYWSSSFYAASNRLYPEVKAMYLLRWKSIMAAKEDGSLTYDFWGIVPNSSQHTGYSDHKLSFGGVRMDTVGLLILPIHPIQSFIWNKGIRIKTYLQDSLRKLVWSKR